MAAYGFYLDEVANQMTVVAVHPDAASVERHVEMGAPEFRKLAPLLSLREIVCSDVPERPLSTNPQRFYTIFLGLSTGT